VTVGLNFGILEKKKKKIPKISESVKKPENDSKNIY